MRTLVNVLVYPLAMTDPCCRQWMHGESQISNSSFTHLLLLCYGGDGEFSRLLLEQREGGDFGFLCVRFPIDAVSEGKDDNIRQVCMMRSEE